MRVTSSSSPADRAPHQPVEPGEERRQRLARARRRHDERIAPRRDLGPAARLRLGRRAEALAKPGRDRGMEAARARGSINTPLRRCSRGQVRTLVRDGGGAYEQVVAARRFPRARVAQAVVLIIAEDAMARRSTASCSPCAATGRADGATARATGLRRRARSTHRRRRAVSLATGSGAAARQAAWRCGRCSACT